MNTCIKNEENKQIQKLTTGYDLVWLKGQFRFVFSHACVQGPDLRHGIWNMHNSVGLLAYNDLI